MAAATTVVHLPCLLTIADWVIFRLPTIFVPCLITPLFGLKCFDRLLDGWSARGSVFMRVWVGFALGLFLAYVVDPDEQAHDDRA